MKTMLLSEILCDIHGIEKYKIINEKEVVYLALVSSPVEFDSCTFIENDIYIPLLTEEIKMVITTKEVCNKILDLGIGVIVVENPRIFYFNLHYYLAENNQEYKGVSFKTRIDNSAKIHKLSCISENNVIIGKNVIIEEFVSIKENVTIHDNAIIRSGSVIGGGGFEFKNNDNKVIPIKHLGGVIINENCEIQYNTCIDKAIYPWDNTVIGEYVKIDNLVHIGHGAKINRCTKIAAHALIGGRVEIGENSWIGISTSIRNGLKLGQNIRVNMGSVVTKDVKDNESVSGNFAISHDKFLENLKKSL